MAKLMLLLLLGVAGAFAQVIPNEYVVLFKSDASAATIAEHMTKIRASAGMSVLKSYDFFGFRGYAVHAKGVDTIESFLTAPEVDHYEQNQIFTTNRPVGAAPLPPFEKVGNRTDLSKNRVLAAQCNVQEEATWGIVRTAESDLNIDGLYTWSDVADGSGISVYVIDTGIYLENIEFEGRAVWGYDAVDDPSPETDENGHGTHCAGTVMSKSYGVAKKAKAIAVRVLDAGGSGSTAGVVDGIQWAAKDGAGKLSVASMSLGGGLSSALNRAVATGVAAGIPFVVAAGNENTDACTKSPASEPSAITVMCSDSTDTFCYFSNYGTCADIIAPGMGITSTWIGSPYSVNTISGTSMSCPHVAGVAAKLLSQEGPQTPAYIKAELGHLAGQGYIKKVPTIKKTLNSLLYDPCN